MNGGGGVFYLCGLFIIIHLIQHVGAACTFPDPIRGNWISSEKGTLNFTNSTLWNYPVVLTSVVTSATFTCESIYNGFYFLKATNIFELFFVNFTSYLCIDFTRISATKYTYSIQCAIETGLLIPSRVFVRPTSVNVTGAVACNRESPTDKSDFSVLVKEDAVGSQLATAKCPNDFLATFSNFTVTDSSGGNQCTGNSLNVCTDRTAMNYTYNSCSSTVKFSSGGYLYCLYHQSNSSTGVTYLHVYNNDSAVVSGSTYRIVCYAFKKSGDIVYTTEYPGSCHGNQNATYVKSPGLITQYFNITKTCVIVVGSEIQDGKYIIAIGCGFVGLIILIIVIVIVIKKRLFCRCCAFMYRKCAHNGKVTQSHGDIEGQEPHVVQSNTSTVKEQNGFIKPKPEREKSFAKEDETRTVRFEVALDTKDDESEVVKANKPSKFVPRDDLDVKDAGSEVLKAKKPSKFVPRNALNTKDDGMEVVKAKKPSTVVPRNALNTKDDGMEVVKAKKSSKFVPRNALNTKDDGMEVVKAKKSSKFVPRNALNRIDDGMEVVKAKKPSKFVPRNALDLKDDGMEVVKAKEPSKFVPRNALDMEDDEMEVVKAKEPSTFVLRDDLDMKDDEMEVVKAKEPSKYVSMDALGMKDDGMEVVKGKELSKFVPRKPRKIKNFTFIIKSKKHVHTLLHIPLCMPELLYEVVPRPTSSRRMFYRTPTFKSEKSLNKIDLVSHNQKENS